MKISKIWFADDRIYGLTDDGRELWQSLLYYKRLRNATDEERANYVCTTEPTPLCSQKTWNRPAFYSFSLHDYEKDIEIFGGYEIITYICSIKQIKQ